MARALSVLRTEMGRLIQDSSGVSQSVLNPVRTDLINKAYRWWYFNMERRGFVATVVSNYSGAQAEMGNVDTASHILSIYNGASGRPLMRMEWNELRLLQIQESATGTPTHYAIYKKMGGAGATPVNQWQIALWPIPPAPIAVVQGVAKFTPTALSADGDVPDVHGFEADCIVFIAAYWAAMMMDRGELAEAIINFLPQMVQAKLAINKRNIEREDPTGRTAGESPI